MDPKLQSFSVINDQSNMQRDTIELANEGGDSIKFLKENKDNEVMDI